MGQQQPEAEDWFRKNIQHSVCDDFAIYVHDAGTIGNSPHTVCYPNISELVSPASISSGRQSLHGIQGPKNQSKKRNRPEKHPGLVILGGHGVPPLVAELVHDVEVRETRERVPAPALRHIVRERGEEAREDHGDVREQEHEDARAAEACEEG